MPRQSKQTIPYNELAVRKVATSKHDTQTEYTIKGVPGLRLIAMPNGTASYAVRITVKGKRRREALGMFGAVELSDVRDKALKVAAGVADDGDVLAEEAKEKAKLTLRKLWEECKRLDDGRSAKTMTDHGYMLEAYVLPKLGNRAAVEITAEDYADLLAEVEDRSKNAARHTKGALSSLYKWAQKRRLVKVNPLAGLGFNHKPRARKRVLSDAEMAKFLRAIDQTDAVTEPVRNIIKLAILTGQRNNEVAGMEVSELKTLDTATPRWDIPGERMKRKNTDQFVPLSRQALGIVRHALATSSNGEHVFAGSTKGRVGGTWRQGHIGQETVSRATALVAKKAGLADVHLHDMRKCITTWLAEHGHATPEVLDAILHHGRKGVTGTHYNHALYEKQVRAALQVWADHIEGLATGKGAAAGNVVTLRA